jgi:DivIVA domain-containing protein
VRVLTVLAILGVLVALFLAAALATRDDAALVPASQDLADLGLPAGPVAVDDVRTVRFGVALRGYRMSEVDVALERLAEELERRDRRIAELEGAGPAVDAPVAAPAPLPPLPGPGERRRAAREEADAVVASGSGRVEPRDLPSGPSAEPLQPPVERPSR